MLKDVTGQKTKTVAPKEINNAEKQKGSYKGALTGKGKGTGRTNTTSNGAGKGKGKGGGNPKEATNRSSATSATRQAPRPRRADVRRAPSAISDTAPAHRVQRR